MRIAIILFLLAFQSLAGPGQVKTNAVLAWDYPTNELSTNMVFKLYSHTNITVPLSNWVVITNIPGTNLAVTVAIQPGIRFYSLTASNDYGESDFSNVAELRVPRRGDNLRIRPGD